MAIFCQKWRKDTRIIAKQLESAELSAGYSKRGMLPDMMKIKDYLNDADVAELKRDFGIVFENVMADEDFDSQFNKMVDEEVSEIEKDDSASNKRLAKISRLITKITTSEKW